MTYPALGLFSFSPWDGKRGFFFLFFYLFGRGGPPFPSKHFRRCGIVIPSFPLIFQKVFSGKGTQNSSTVPPLPPHAQKQPPSFFPPPFSLSLFRWGMPQWKEPAGLFFIPRAVERSNRALSLPFPLLSGYCVASPRLKPGRPFWVVTALAPLFRFLLSDPPPPPRCPSEGHSTLFPSL